ncbi:response regulator [Deltaproteobacteria bacterium TL4]
MNRGVFHILVVDDDDTILYLMDKMLTGAGHHCALSSNPLEALELFEEHPFDLVLTDIMMPQMNGLDFLKRVVAFKPHVPVIIMTGDPNLPCVKLALKEGALDFLEKPFDLEKIVDIISRFASKRLSSRTVSLRNKELLFISPKLKKERELNRALQATGGNLTKRESEQEALAALPSTPCHLVINSLDSNIPDLEFYSKFHEISPQSRIVSVMETYNVEQLTSLMEVPHLDAVVIKNNSFSEAEFIVGLRKLFSRDIFGLEKYLRWGFEPIQHITKHTDDRFRFIEKMSEYLQSLKVSNQFISRLENVADEFLTNALYNAPVGEDGKALYREVERTAGRPCTEREKTVLSYAYDGNYFGISIEDNYGTLTKKDIFEGLKRCLDEQGNPSQKSGGAGLGLYLSFLILNKLIINIRPGKKTEMIGLCDIRSTVKDFNLLDKSLSIFVEA